MFSWLILFVGRLTWVCVYFDFCDLCDLLCRSFGGLRLLFVVTVWLGFVLIDLFTFVVLFDCGC